MDKDIKYLTEPAQRVMNSALQDSKQQGRAALLPSDVFRALAETSEGRHVRILVDSLKLNLSQLREAAKGWEFECLPEEDWNYKILSFASMEAALAARQYVSTEHLLVTLVNLWPQAPCSRMVLQAAGGSINSLRHYAYASW